MCFSFSVPAASLPGQVDHPPPPPPPPTARLAWKDVQHVVWPSLSLRCAITFTRNWERTRTPSLSHTHPLVGAKAKEMMFPPNFAGLFVFLFFDFYLFDAQSKLLPLQVVTQVFSSFHRPDSAGVCCSGRGSSGSSIPDLNSKSLAHRWKSLWKE